MKGYQTAGHEIRYFATDNFTGDGKTFTDFLENFGYEMKFMK
ncbi:MAG: hypothetical protein PHX08_06805 [Lachnospiraceae bacterium]|nr:hypothetical protein [Lachnospiraceae bacterium]